MTNMLVSIRNAVRIEEHVSYEQMIRTEEHKDIRFLTESVFQVSVLLFFCLLNIYIRETFSFCHSVAPSLSLSFYYIL